MRWRSWLSGDPAEAEDIVQDAALRALTALETGERRATARVVSAHRPQHGVDLDRENRRSRGLHFVGGAGDLAAMRPSTSPLTPTPEAA